MRDSVEMVAALTSPRNAVLVGATDRPGSWGSRVLRNLTKYPFQGEIYLVNPSRTEIAGRPCYPSLAALPEPPDHLIVLVPAAAVAGVLEAGAAAGARSATVFSAGFGESLDKSGEAHRTDVLNILARTGLAMTGPNCMGNVFGPVGLVSLTEERPLDPRSGPVAIVGQSGGVVVYLNASLEERGVKAGYLITSGNELGLDAADYISYFATVPDVRVVVVYIEAVRSAERLAAAAAAAKVAGKHIVLVKLGSSEAGRTAALAHTGAIAGDIAAFDAFCRRVGIVRVDTLDEAVEAVELLVHTGAPGGTRLGAITLSGAFRGLLMDAAERQGVTFPPLEEQTTRTLTSLLGVGSMVGNPIDGGFGVLTKPEAFMGCLQAMQDDPNVDMVLIQETLPKEAGSVRAEKYIRMVNEYVANGATKPVAFVTLASHGQTEYSRSVRGSVPHVSFLQEANKALRAIVSTTGFQAPHLAIEKLEMTPEREAIAALLLPPRSGGHQSPTLLNETQSKRLLAGWNISSPPEATTTSLADACAAAEKIGYPVVLKAVSATIAHKSDVGGVALNLRNRAELEHAWHSIHANISTQGLRDALDGVLVAKQISGGLELVLGVHRDAEVGHVVMVGLGGIWLELFKDVAFACPPITREVAEDMLSRTRVNVLLNGYRGGPPLDREAVIVALMGLGEFADQVGNQVQGVDINPFIALPAGRGGFALDALVVLDR